MTGRSAWRAISRTISSVKAPGCAETPANTVTLALRTTSRSEMSSPPESSRFELLLVLRSERLLAGANSLAAFDEEAEMIEGVDAAARLLFGQRLLPSWRRSADLMMPTPAEPEPNMAMVCSRSGMPVALTAASRVAVVTAAVP